MAGEIQSLQSHYSLMTISLDAVSPEIVTASLNEKKI